MIFILTKSYPEGGSDIIAGSTDPRPLAVEADRDFYGDARNVLPLHFNGPVGETQIAHTPYHGVTYMITPIKEVR